MKKGFTLIELLAVIVILAILALIVSPIISGVISDAKKASAERSTEGYVKAVEYAQVQYQYKNGGSITTDINKLSISAQGIDRVTVTSMEFNNSGIVTNATITIDEYTCNYFSGKAVCDKGSIQSVTANVDFTTHVINNTWEELKIISSQIAADNSITSTSTTAHGLTVGDKITVDGLTCYIAGFNHSSDETGITLVADSGKTHNMNSTDDNTGGWNDSIMRTYMQSDAFTSNFPTILANAKLVAKKSDTGNGTSAILFTPSNDAEKDKLWLLSFEEVGFTSVESYGGYFVSGEGTMYPLFKEGTTTEALKCRTDLYTSRWWLRSSNTINSDHFWRVDSGGRSSVVLANSTGGVVFGFCI